MFALCCSVCCSLVVCCYYVLLLVVVRWLFSCLVVVFLFFFVSKIFSLMSRPFSTPLYSTGGGLTVFYFSLLPRLLHSKDFPFMSAVLLLCGVPKRAKKENDPVLGRPIYYTKSNWKKSSNSVSPNSLNF